MSADTLQPTLFEQVEPLNGSGPLAKLNHPVQSHKGADRAQRTMHRTKVWVLRIVAVHGELPGSEINEVFPSFVPREDRVAFDTPRKRAGELAVDGFLAKRTEKSDGNHLDEGWYSLTEKGRRAVA